MPDLLHRGDTSTRRRRRRRGAAAGCVLLAGLALLAAPGASAAIHLAVMPASFGAMPGDTVTVELTITEAGSAFNAYDAYLEFEPARLTFLAASPLSSQEGPLMKDACPNRWHQFALSPDSTLISISHSLLCLGVSLTGPGVVYRLQFRCKPVLAETYLRLTPATTFYDNGLFVTPVLTADARITIGDGADVPPAVRPPELVAAPNPFNPRTELSFRLETGGAVRLAVYGPDGRLVRRLLEETLPAGPHGRAWDGRDERGCAVASGCYLVRLEAGGRIATTPVTLVR